MRPKGGGFTGNGCVGEYYSPGMFPAGHGALLDLVDRLDRTRLKMNSAGYFVTTPTAGIV